MGSTFRFICWPGAYDRSLDFYQNQLECPVLMQWDRSPVDRGIVFQLGSGEIELLQQSPEKPALKPQGFELLVEVEDVDEFYRFAIAKAVPTRGEPANKPWGHRTFSVIDPDGLKIIFFSPVKTY